MVLEFVSAVALIMGLTEVLKRSRLAGKRSRFAPVIALAIGVAFACAREHAFTTATVVEGLTNGLIAMGLYSGGDKTING